MTSPKSNKRPLFSRIIAFIIDLIILGAACAVLSKYLFNYFPDSPFLFHCIGTLICLFYFAAFNSNIVDGKTIGKMICGIQVTNLINQPISFLHACLRSMIVIIPLCFIDFIQPFTQGSFGFSLLNALFTSIVLVSFYLVIFNRNTSQSLHDILSKTQIQNKALNFLAKPPIWKGHYLVSMGLVVIIITSSLWLHSKMTDSSDIKQLALSSSIQSLSIENRYTTMGETRSQNNVLIFNVDANQALNDRDFFTQQVMLLKVASPKLYSENEINQVQFNSSYQFGLARFSKSVIYDLSFNQGQALISFNGDRSSTGLGF